MSQDSTLSLRRSLALPYVEMRGADRSAACYRPHSHDEFSFGVVDEGWAEYRNGRHRNRIGAGSTVTINPGDVHACNPDAGRWSYRMLFVEASWLGQLQRELTGSHQDYLSFPAMLASSTRAYWRFDRLFAVLEAEANALRAESLLIEYLQPLFAPSRSSGASAARHSPELAAVREAILDQLDSNLSLDGLCQIAGLSRYQLIRRFKQAYGQAPHAYQLDQRIKKAKFLLRQGDGLTAVALKLGFADQAHFQRHFKLRSAITPGQYKSFFV